MKRRTEITIETERLVVVGGRRQRVIRWCVPCDMHVEMLSTDEAALLAHVSSRTIFSWVETDKIHYTETDEGLLLVCPNSLF